MRLRPGLCFWSSALAWVVTISAAGVAGGSARQANATALSPAIPPPAIVLAHRLGLQGIAVVGNQPHSSQSSWVLWITPQMDSQFRGGPVTITGPGHRHAFHAMPATRVLSVGPLGARGEYDYYDIASAPVGIDRFHGRVPSSRVDERLALSWLRKGGTPVPAAPPLVVHRKGTTIIGGTGLCCYASLDTVSWSSPSRRIVVYLADGGHVVEVDVMLRHGVSGFTSSPCTQRRDAAGVALGRWCVDYEDAATLQFIAVLGGHQSWMESPPSIVFGFAHGSKVLGKVRGPLRATASPAGTRTFIVRAGARSYRVTVAPIFPRLTDSIWAIESVTRA